MTCRQSSVRQQIVGEIKAIAADLSGMAPEELCASTPFMMLGFDSLFLTQLAALVQKAFGVRVAFRELIELTPTIETLAEYIEKTAPPKPLPPPTREEPLAHEPVIDTAREALSPVTQPEGSSAGARAGDDGGLADIFAAQLALMQEQLAMLVEARDRAAPCAAAVIPNVRDIGTEKEEEAARSSTVEVEHVPYEKSEPPASFAPPADVAASTLSAAQRAHIDRLTAFFNAKTPGSKIRADRARAFFADPRTAAGFNPLWKEMVYPLVVERSEGAYLWDVDGNRYIDLLNGFGPNFFGHRAPFIVESLKAQLDRGFEVGPQTPLAGEAAELFCELTGMERVSWVNTGSEAVQAAIRVARTVTGRNKIVAFAGSYHGNFDEVLYSRAVTAPGRKPRPMAPGVPDASVENVILLEYGDQSALDVIAENADEIALVMVEPVQSRRPEFQPKEFLHALRALTEERGVVLLFDEVITGFRIGPGGAQEHFGVRADLATYGKVIGGGMPIGAIAGSKRFMDTFDGGAWRFGDDSAPTAGVTFFAGTFVRHPMAIAAAHAALSYIKAAGPALHARVNALAERFARELNAFFSERGVRFEVAQFASQLFIRTSGEGELADLFFHHMRAKAVHVLEGFPSYLTAAHTDEDVDAVIAAAKAAVLEMQADGVLPLRDGASAPAPERSFPLTDVQRDIWIAAQMGGRASCAFNESDTFRITGDVDDAALLAALDDAIGAHEAFRLRFDADVDAGAPRQRVAAHTDIQITQMDLRGRCETERRRVLDDLLAREASTPFDLAHGPLARIHLIRTGAKERMLVLYAHHLIFDGYAADLFIRDVASRYNTGAGSGAPQAFGAYAAFAGRPAARQAALRYWREAFDGAAPVPLNLPTDRAFPATRSFAGATASTTLPGELQDAVSVAAQREGVSAAAFFIAAYAVLLSNLTGEEDVVVGAPTAGQATSGIDAVGCCVGMVPLKVSARADKTFRALAHETQAALARGASHGGARASALASALREPEGARRDRKRPPIVQAVLNYSRYFGDVTLGDATVTPMENPRRAVQYELFLNLRDGPEGLAADWDYATDLFDEATVRGWLSDFAALAAMAADNPGLTLSALGAAPASGAREADEAWVPEGVQLANENALRAEPADETMGEAMNEGVDPFFSPMEEFVSDVFRRILKIEKVGPEDNFFDLGGHSILAVRALAMIREEAAPKLPLRALFDAENVRDLAQRVESEMNVQGTSPMTPFESAASRGAAIPAGGLAPMQSHEF